MTKPTLTMGTRELPRGWLTNNPEAAIGFRAADAAHDRARASVAHLPLAEKIAGAYANIPGVSMDDVRAVAQAALHRAAQAFDPARGEFEPYAAQAIRIGFVCRPNSCKV